MATTSTYIPPPKTGWYLCKYGDFEGMYLYTLGEWWNIFTLPGHDEPVLTMCCAPDQWEELPEGLKYDRP